MSGSDFSMERYVVAVFCHLLLLASETVSGTLLEMPSWAGRSLINTSKFGVDVTRCTGLTFQLKACYYARIWLGDGTETGSYEVDITKKSCYLGKCGYCSSPALTSYTTSNYIVSCHLFREFWMTWGNNQIAFGKGNVTGSDKFFEIADPKFHGISVLSFRGYPGYTVRMRLGTDDNSRLRMVSDNAKFSDAPLAVMTTSFFNCSLFCHKAKNCGMLSFNSAENACAVFNRKTSSFALAPQAGWKSWKMIYC